MQVNLVVTKEDNVPGKESRSFNQEIITIGRDSSSTLHLPDPKRIVGRSHAKIVTKGDIVQLIDLGAKNFTFLADEQLVAGKAYTLKEGDTFKIGDYIIQFEGITKDEPAPETDITVIDQTYPNPFLDEAKALAEIIKQINEQYAGEVPNRRDEQLKEALSGEIKAIEPAPVAALISAHLKPTGDISFDADQSRSENGSLSMSDRIRYICDVLLTSFAKFIKAPWNFRLEFIGQTIISSAKTFSFHSSTLQEIREFLLSANISEPDFNKRVAVLSKEADEVMVHQLALIDGYKVSVNEGSRHILEHFNPAVLRKILDEKAIKLGRIEIPYRYLPVFYHWKLLQLYQQKYSELAGEDKGFFETKLFRPGFINGYLERLSSARNRDLNSDKHDDS